LLLEEKRDAVSLTAREREVLAWVARGKTNSEIARILSLAPSTVAKHLEHIFEKLGVERRTAAARIAFEATTIRDSSSRKPLKDPQRKTSR